MVKNSLYLVTLVFFVLVAVAGFFNKFSIETIFIRGSIFALFMMLWGVVAIIVSAIIKSEAEAKLALIEEDKNEGYTTSLDHDDENEND